MPLSCSCPDWFDYYCEAANDFSVLDTFRRKRCESCNKLIDIKSLCLKFRCYRDVNSDVEEAIYGDTRPLADRYLCESCGEVFLNFESLGYCVGLGENMKELLMEYHELTGFKRG